MRFRSPWRAPTVTISRGQAIVRESVGVDKQRRRRSLGSGIAQAGLAKAVAINLDVAIAAAVMLSAMPIAADALRQAAGRRGKILGGGRGGERHEPQKRSDPRQRPSHAIPLQPDWPKCRHGLRDYDRNLADSRATVGCLQSADAHNLSPRTPSVAIAALRAWEAAALGVVGLDIEVALSASNAQALVTQAASARSAGGQLIGLASRWPVTILARTSLSPRMHPTGREHDPSVLGGPFNTRLPSTCRVPEKLSRSAAGRSGARNRSR